MSDIIDLLAPYVKKHKYNFVILNIATIVSAFSQTLIPLQVNKVIDQGIKNKNQHFLLVGFVMILIFALMDLLAGMGQRFSSVRFAQNIMFDIRQDLYETLQYQELEYYSSETIGQIMSRTIEEVFSLRDILTWGYRIGLLLIWLFVGSFIVMVRISIPLSLVFIIIPPVLLGISWITSKNNVSLFYDARYKYGAMNEVLAENLTGIQTVKSFGREMEQIAKFNVKNQEFYESSLKTAKLRATLQPGMIFIISIALIVLIFIGGVFVSNGEISPGNFVAFMLLVLQIAVPGRFAGWLGIIYQNTQSAAIRLNEIFKAPVTLTNKPDAIELKEVEGEIEFENVSFNYPGSVKTSGPNTLHHISFKIPSGQKVALLGPTGSGKSSLINLIPRFFDSTEGRILIDNKDISNFTLKSLRSHIGIVHQEAFLFTLSIHENIAFGNVKATREDVINAAKMAQIHDFIDSLEYGYDTIVGERGVTLSGGQRQRVTIARTLLQNPKILIFDDSVSAVDPETEARIQESLESASSKRTTIIISQRPSSLKFVDRIIVLDKGHIVQDGTHAELREVDGIYKNFQNAVEKQIKILDWDANNIEEESYQ